MELVIEPDCSMPCHLKVFTINGIKADKDNFGNGNSEDGADGGFGCANYQFHPISVREYVIEKYKISNEEY